MFAYVWLRAKGTHEYAVAAPGKKGYPVTGADVALIQTMPGALQSLPWILIYPHDHPERVVASSSRGPVCSGQL